MGMLELLPAGEFPIIKFTKYGVYVNVNGSKLFIPFSNTFTDPRKLEEGAAA